ncbi:FHA domain-containing protein [Thermocoleostomius sinensis]|uniref:FHA domain-containing protein n=1 Tax=Thermocoleostomius sinensis A174 TaxID=2016057 RepID=A0A9E8ZE05_9CYAN|nr:FHA domain-containing protein [Thermocoleostomius sinensis]WAL61071.1 FHA domain-containing protein [Thermocoleostomius sinensis A174]
MITLTLLHPLKQIPIQVWTFPDESKIRIGRSTDNQVVLYSAVVSRHHVELHRVGNQWEVVNLGTNGTYIDGRRITQEPVTDGVIIRLARSGPNIQIRIGDAVLEELQDTVSALRSLPTRSDLPLITTEITQQAPEEDDVE